jgi:hypothetical protein
MNTFEDQKVRNEKIKRIKLNKLMQNYKKKFMNISSNFSHKLFASLQMLKLLFICI